MAHGVLAPANPSRDAAGAVLPAEFYARPVLEVARDLLGCVVRHGDVSGRIAETEAYHEREPACHAFNGPTPRAAVLFSEPGTAYVYRSYGIHALLNAVCEPRGSGAAVLIRALEPLEGIAAMRARRAVARDRELCNGPGKLTQALAIGLEHNATSLVGGAVRIEAGARRTAVVTGPRIGITRAAELPWRFCAAGSDAVSRPLPPAMRRPG
jgi:DNA-3-methyladenine glycosylase